MNIVSNITSATRAALLYITAGAVGIVWSSIWYWYLSNHPPTEGTVGPYYWCAGFLMTGVVLLVIGLGIGWIGRTAQPAEQPHAVVPSQDGHGHPTQDVVQLSNNPVPVAPLVQQPAVVVQPPIVQPQPPLAVATGTPTSRA